MPTYPTVTLQKVVDEIASFIGIQWADIDTEIQTSIVGFINDRQEDGLDEYDWPKYTDFEKRYFEYGKWFSGTYPANAIVYYEPDDKYYKNTSGGNTTGVPGTSSDWAENTDYKSIISYTQPHDTDSTNVDQIWAVYDENPNGDDYREEYAIAQSSSDWTDASTGTSYEAIHVNKGSILYVWIKYTIDPTTHSRTDLTTTLPKFLKGFVVRAAFADYMTQNLQDSKASYHLSQARKRLDQQYDKIMYRQGGAGEDTQTVQFKEFA